MASRLATATVFLMACALLPAHATDAEKRRAKADEILERLGRVEECRSRIGEVRKYIEICGRVIRDLESKQHSGIATSRAHYNRGLGFMILGEPQSAIIDYSAAIRIMPNFSHAYLSRAIAYAVLGDDRRALEDYNEAIRWSQFDPIAIAYYNRSLSHKKLKDNASEKRDLDKAISLDPGRSWERAYKIGQHWFAPPPKD